MDKAEAIKNFIVDIFVRILIGFVYFDQLGHVSWSYTEHCGRCLQFEQIIGAYGIFEINQ